MVLTFCSENVFVLKILMILVLGPFVSSLMLGKDG